MKLWQTKSKFVARVFVSILIGVLLTTYYSGAQQEITHQLNSRKRLYQQELEAVVQTQRRDITEYVFEDYDIVVKVRGLMVFSGHPAALARQHY